MQDACHRSHRRNAQTFSSLTGFALWSVIAIVVGSASADGPVLPSPEPPGRRAAPAVEPIEILDVKDGGLSLDELVEMAVAANPIVAMAQARVEAARGALLQAGLYPNPTVWWWSNQMGAKIGGAGEQGPIVRQPVVTAGKLRKAKAVAGAGLEAADWQAVTRYFEVVTRVRLAYFEVLTARQQLETSREVVRIADDGLKAAINLQNAGAGTKPDVLRARTNLEQNKILLVAAERRVEAARRLLAASVGVPKLPDEDIAGTLEFRAPNFEYAAVLDAVLVQNSEFREAEAIARQAEQQLRLARAVPVPDLQLGFRPFYNSALGEMHYYAEVGATLPVWNKNQGNIMSAAADIHRTRRQIDQVQLLLTERLATANQRYESALQQVRIFRDETLPDAQESLQLVLLGYERGDPLYNYNAVIDSQRTLIQVRLNYVQTLGELWRSISEIAGLLQLHELPLTP